MRGRRPGKTGGVFAGIRRGFFRAENDADGRESFAVVERSMSDRLLGPAALLRRSALNMRGLQSAGTECRLDTSLRSAVC